MQDVDDLDRIVGIAEEDDVRLVRRAAQTEAEIVSISAEGATQVGNAPTRAAQALNDVRRDVVVRDVFQIGLDDIQIVEGGS